MLYLFIDTNIFLDFFHYSDDDLEELRKLFNLMKEEKVTLYLPEQVKHEFYRNRELKINDAVKRLNDAKLIDSFPQFCKEYDTYNQLQKLAKAFAKERKKLIDEMSKDISEEKLKADTIIKDLFEESHLLDSNEFYDRAIKRYNLGDPPGKDKSYGDAIIWLTLLEKVTSGKELYFVTGDKDYQSIRDKKRFNPYLFKEWERKKDSQVRYYNRLSQFFKDNFPDIHLDDESEKYERIQNLIHSSSFAQTHAAITALSEYDQFTPEERALLIKASSTNPQIVQIAGDDDVWAFFGKLRSTWP